MARSAALPHAAVRASRRRRPSRSATASRRWRDSRRQRGRDDRVRLERRRSGAGGAPAPRGPSARRASAPGSAGAAVELAAQPGPDSRAAGPRRRACDRSATSPHVDLERESRATTAASACPGCCASSAGRCSSAWCSSSSTRWLTLAGPVLVKTGIDNGVSTGSQAVLFAAVGGLSRRHPGRPHRRDRRDVRHRPGRPADHAVAAHPHLGPAPAALARLLRARDGRPDHDPDDDRRRPVRVADRERAAARRWSRS